MNTYYKSMDNLNSAGLISYKKGKHNVSKAEITILKITNSIGSSVNNSIDNSIVFSPVNSVVNSVVNNNNTTIQLNDNTIKQIKSTDFDFIINSEQFKDYLKSKDLQIKNLPHPDKINLFELKEKKKSEFKNKTWAIIQNLNGSSEFWTKDDFKEAVKFCDYWSESKEKGKLLKWEMQKTFDLSLRMKTWKNNSTKFNPKEKEKSDIEKIKERLHKKYYGDE